MATSSQWIFPVTSLYKTPSLSSAHMTSRKELLDRAQGISFLFRVGCTLQLPLTALLTAATFLHRFYMRNALADYHQYEIAATCLFLATKIEESGRKLRDLAHMCVLKATKGQGKEVDEKELKKWQDLVLAYEEVVLQSLCFDFVVQHPHLCLAEYFKSSIEYVNWTTQECAWTIATDSLRTPLCLLFPPQIIAAASYVLAKKICDGHNAPSIDELIFSGSAPWKAGFRLSDRDIPSVVDAISVILEFYSIQTNPELPDIRSIHPPANARLRLYQDGIPIIVPPQHANGAASSDGGRTPATVITGGASTPNGWHANGNTEPVSSAGSTLVAEGNANGISNGAAT